MKRPTDFNHESGIFFEGITKPGDSAVFTVAAHRGLTATTTGDQTFFLEAPEAAVLRIAVYGPSVVSKGWEPYDQPTPSAYMPLPRSAFDWHPLPDGGALLIQMHSKQQAIRSAAVVDGQHRFCEFLNHGAVTDLRGRLARALAEFEVPHDAVDFCVAAVEQKLADGLRRLAS